MVREVVPLRVSQTASQRHYVQAQAPPPQLCVFERQVLARVTTYACAWAQALALLHLHVFFLALGAATCVQQVRPSQPLSILRRVSYDILAHTPCLVPSPC